VLFAQFYWTLTHLAWRCGLGRDQYQVKINRSLGCARHPLDQIGGDLSGVKRFILSEDGELDHEAKRD
jgi:hypothetical protein